MSEEEIKQNEKDTAKQSEKPSEGKKEQKKGKDAKKIEELTAELQKQKELLLRTAAEFDNFKRRTEKERTETYQRATSAALKNFLPVFDNVDRAAASDPGSEEYHKGIEMIVKQLTAMTEQLGLIPIGNVGDPFDPNLHEAVMHIEDENLPENSIAAVLQKGYQYGDTVIRPAMVQVAN